ncbi:thiamine diphosphokinase [uncultured Veillonella sp.]|uniref:thiamine diphosphokinase n=1 Tax=uncultured Veillonella sp. TaxID=159268 RepID=UPI0025E909BF|nr:thiamine diphosphokinase [uncultured Veillonella sp.]MDY3973895.1 thiamine diphosphokinase [Veillonella caviae]
MEKICAIILGGTKDCFDYIDEADFVIACDKGYAYAQEAGITPDLLVGDFDSYEGVIPEHIKVLQLPVEKDDTDTLAALRYVINEGFTQIYMYCAFGGRFDHLWGNIQAASFAASEGAIVTLHSTAQTVYIFKNHTVVLPPKANRALSVLALSDHCEGVTIEGTKYEVEQASLTNIFPLGVSNEWQGTATISVEQGLLMVVESVK